METGPVWTFGQHCWSCVLYSCPLLLLWPETVKVTAVDMNWAFLVWGFAMLICTFWYLIRARYYYHGPVRDVVLSWELYNVHRPYTNQSRCPIYS